MWTREVVLPPTYWVGPRAKAYGTEAFNFPVLPIEPCSPWFPHFAHVLSLQDQVNSLVALRIARVGWFSHGPRSFAVIQASVSRLRIGCDFSMIPLAFKLTTKTAPPLFIRRVLIQSLCSKLPRFTEIPATSRSNRIEIATKPGPGKKN